MICFDERTVFDGVGEIRRELKGIEAMVGALQEIKDLKAQVAEYKEAYEELYKKYWALKPFAAV